MQPGYSQIEIQKLQELRPVLGQQQGMKRTQFFKKFLKIPGNLSPH